MQLVGNISDPNGNEGDAEGDLMLMDDEEEIKEAHDHQQHIPVISQSH